MAGTRTRTVLCSQYCVGYIIFRAVGTVQTNTFIIVAAEDGSWPPVWAPANVGGSNVALRDGRITDNREKKEVALENQG